MEVAPSEGGQPNMTPSSSTPKIPRIISSIKMPSNESHIWHPAWSPRKRQHGANFRPMCGGIPSFPPTARRRLGMPHRSRREFFTEFCWPSSEEGDCVLDFFAGSGTTAAVAQRLSRRFVMVDNNKEAIAVMAKRLGKIGVRFVNNSLNPLAVDFSPVDQPVLFV